VDFLSPKHGCDPAAAVDCGDLGIRIDRQGRWYYHGSPIARREMVCLFASMLCRDADGSYLLVAPGEIGRIEVEDVPFLAVEMFVGGAGREQILSFRTNVDALVTLDADHPLRLAGGGAGADAPAPYLGLEGGLEARLTRSVYYELVARGWEEERDGEKVYGVWSSGVFFPLGRLTPPE
jgi:hypothetical protein